MKRTTLELDEPILRRLKLLAAAEGSTLQDVTNKLLRRALAEQERAPYSLKLKGWDAAVQPGVDILDRDALFDVFDGR